MKKVPQPDVNLFDLETQQCPYPAYTSLRDEAPAYRCPLSGMFVITRFEDVRRVLTDHENFTNRTSIYGSDSQPNPRLKAITELFEEEGWLPAATLAGRDDPDHKAIRAVFNEA